MSEPLDVSKVKKDDVLFLILKGMITEDSQIENIDSSGEPTVVIDLHGITRINSYGIRQWINNLKRLGEKSPNIVFTRCPPAIVEQFNMISNFGANGTVYSFYLPFYSDKKDKDELVLYELDSGNTSADYPQMIEASAAKLDASAEFVFNDIEDEYFSFLQFQKQKQVAPAVAQVIKQTCV